MYSLFVYFTPVNLRTCTFLLLLEWRSHNSTVTFARVRFYSHEYFTSVQIVNTFPTLLAFTFVQPPGLTPLEHQPHPAFNSSGCKLRDSLLHSQVFCTGDYQTGGSKTQPQKCQSAAYVISRPASSCQGSSRKKKNTPINHLLVPGALCWVNRREAGGAAENQENMDPSSRKDQGEHRLHQTVLHRQGP